MYTLSAIISKQHVDDSDDEWLVTLVEQGEASSVSQPSEINTESQPSEIKPTASEINTVSQPSEKMM